VKPRVVIVTLLLTVIVWIAWRSQLWTVSRPGEAPERLEVDGVVCRHNGLHRLAVGNANHDFGGALTRDVGDFGDVSGSVGWRVPEYYVRHSLPFQDLGETRE